MSAVEHLHTRLRVPQPAALHDWESRIAAWCDEYKHRHGAAGLSEVNLGFAVFLFDHVAERVTLAYAVSVPQLHPRDRTRIRGFPDVNVGVRAALCTQAFAVDRGHFLGHASGGELDINLFPQRRELNRGWSDEGKLFRQMEHYVAAHRGCFFYHRPVYDDATWIPSVLEYGVLKSKREWWRSQFHNKMLSAANSPHPRP